ncbi:hypothetical protein [Methylophilus sp. QUAN]|uniref:hypothetical protein n=1 Tax=Methylophilus sp. QUAN TaxID=2781020 RepID=UPI00188DE4EB|nr:hypothetical protein [Methylophilus sp. QUAN]MBF4991036.1 hypothetical protein [Methylophilus sp. QUAN]
MSAIHQESIPGLNVRLEYASALLASQIKAPDFQSEMDDALLGAFEFGISDASNGCTEMPAMFKEIAPLQHAWCEGRKWHQKQIEEDKREREEIQNCPYCLDHQLCHIHG